MLLKLYVQTRAWITACLRLLQPSDRGSVTVEQAIVTGVVAVAAVGLGAAIWALVDQATSRWELW